VLKSRIEWFNKPVDSRNEWTCRVGWWVFVGFWSNRESKWFSFCSSCLIVVNNLCEVRKNGDVFAVLAIVWFVK